MRSIAAAAAAAAGLALATAAQATIVEVTFQGVVTDDFGDILPTVGAGAAFSGVFRYDTNGPLVPGDGDEGTTVASYHSMLSYSVLFEENDGGVGPDEDIGFTANTLAGPSFFETVTNDQMDPFDGSLIDAYSNRVALVNRDLSGNVLETWSWGISLNSRDGGPFSSTDLPTSLNLSDFDVGSFSMSFDDGSGLLTPPLDGDITSLTSTIIPSPGAGALMALGGLAALRRRR